MRQILVVMMILHVAEHQRRLFQPGHAAQRGQVGLHDEIAIALGSSSPPCSRAPAPYRCRWPADSCSHASRHRRIRRRTRPGSACRSAGPACRRRRPEPYRSRRRRSPSSTDRNVRFPAISRLRKLCFYLKTGHAAGSHSGRICSADGQSQRAVWRAGLVDDARCTSLNISTTFAARSLSAAISSQNFSAAFSTSLPFGCRHRGQLQACRRCAQLGLAAPVPDACGSSGPRPSQLM
jgi:hypothetical protein